MDLVAKFVAIISFQKRKKALAYFENSNKKHENLIKWTVKIARLT
jgi:hypothetical protein